MTLTDLPMNILVNILSYNTAPWSISTCRRLYDAEEQLHDPRLERIYLPLSQLVRMGRWEEAVFLANNTHTYLDIDTIYYIMDNTRYITGRKILEDIIPHLSRSQRRDLLRNLFVYEETSILTPLISSYRDVYDSDAKYIIKYGWMDLIQLLIDKYKWSIKGILHYAIKYGKLEVYILYHTMIDVDIRSISLIAANNDRVNILEYIANHEEDEDLLSYIYDHTWSSITRSYIEDRNKEDSVLSTVSGSSYTEELELYI